MLRLRLMRDDRTLLPSPPAGVKALTDHLHNRLQLFTSQEGCKQHGPSNYAVRPLEKRGSASINR